MSKSILITEAKGKVAKQTRGSSWSLRQMSTARDSMRLVVFGIAAIAALTFFGSMLAVLLMHAP